MIFLKNHFPIDGHLIYFQSFAIIKIAALYMFSLCENVRKLLEVELLDRRVGTFVIL